MMSLTFGLFTQVSGSGPLGPLVSKSQTLKIFFFLPDLVISLRKVVYLHIICGNM